MMMLSWRKPSAESTRRFLTAQAKLDFSYSAVGATASQLPAGFVVDRTRIKLGEGEPVFQAARAALQRWKQFDLGWLEVWSPETPIQTGGMVAIVARAMGLWWLNACKIVYVVDESGPINRFGLAYGTLPDHAGSGEERFLIEWDQADNSVWYDILAFSRPNHFLTRLGYPIVRRTQKRFGGESAAAVLKAVRSDDEVRADRH
jgi:uncharacterized protein (UPF0548 family)